MSWVWLCKVGSWVLPFRLETESVKLIVHGSTETCFVLWSWFVGVKRSFLPGDWHASTDQRAFAISLLSSVFIIASFMPLLWIDHPPFAKFRYCGSVVQLRPLSFFTIEALWLYDMDEEESVFLPQFYLLCSLGTPFLFDLPGEAFGVYFQSTLEHIHDWCFWPSELMIGLFFSVPPLLFISR